MLLRQIFREEEPAKDKAAAAGSLQTGSSWAADVFGGVNQAINKPEELVQPSTADADSTTADANTTGSAQTAGVTAADDLITMIKGFEGYGEKVNPAQGTNSPVRPYWDVAQWSIGYGSYAGSRNRSQRPNIQWTPAQADQALRTQLVPYRRNVESINRSGRYGWTSSQLDALTSFAYNLGSINELTQNGTRSNREIADKMMEYVNAGGQRLPGLVARRQIEREKFLNGMPRGRLNYAPRTGPR
jgi:GH24 family phage-related lysozyme (muramidase)